MQVKRLRRAPESLGRTRRWAGTRSSLVLAPGAQRTTMRVPRGRIR
jgi:hypothetical protein